MRVCVTGIGCVSGIGLNVEEHLRSFRDGRDGLGAVTLFPTRHEEPVSEVKRTNEALKEQLGIPVSAALSRTALLGMTAAFEALADSGLDLSDRDRPLRVGQISSTSTGGMDLTESFYPSFRENPAQGRLRYVASHDAGDSTERIASFLGITGFRTTVSTACSSAANAIMLGARMIRQGMLDVVVAGGTDALCKFTLNGFASLMILDKKPCRPFDVSRAGLNLGEGAGYLVLQSEATVGKTPYCLLSGYANANDAFHQTASSSEGTGAFLAMKGALDKAGPATGGGGLYQCARNRYPEQRCFREPGDPSSFREPDTVFQFDESLYRAYLGGCRSPRSRIQRTLSGTGYPLSQSEFHYTDRGNGINPCYPLSGRNIPAFDIV